MDISNLLNCLVFTRNRVFLPRSSSTPFFIYPPPFLPPFLLLLHFLPLPLLTIYKIIHTLYICLLFPLYIPFSLSLFFLPSIFHPSSLPLYLPLPLSSFTPLRFPSLHAYLLNIITTYLTVT